MNHVACLAAWHPVVPEHPAPEPGWFDAAQQLRGIKHRYLNDTTRYSLAAALKVTAASAEPVADERRGLFLGTAVADFAVREAFDRQVLEGGAEALNTVSAPNISANIAAAHVAIACRARAFATTLTAPFLAGFEALFLGLQALALDQADQVLVVAAEEALPGSGAAQVWPGAAALCLLPAAADAHGLRLHGLLWGRDSATGRLPAALVRALHPRLPHGERPHVLAVHDGAPASASLALRCTEALAPLAQAQPTFQVCSGPGALAPVLRAMHGLAGDRPVVLLAVHERRLLAFLAHP